MAGQALSIPIILAGPILQRHTCNSVTLWLASSELLRPLEMKAEVWDPLPDSVAGYVPEPRPGLTLAGSLRTPYDVELRAVGKSLFVYRITLKAETDQWPRNRALAYRIAPTGTDWIAPPGGAELLPADPEQMTARNTRASPKVPFPHAWFSIDPLEHRWSVLAVHGAATGTWPEAETYLARMCRGSQQRQRGTPNVRGANTEPGRPTTALVLGVDEIPHDEEAVATLVQLIAKDVEASLAAAICGYVLAFSPGLWDFIASATAAHPPSRPPARKPDPNTVTRARSVALTKLSTHVPLYGIPTRIFEQTGVDSLAQQAAKQAFAICFGWGNVGGEPTPRGLDDFSLATDYTTGAPPYIRVFFSLPDKLPHPKESTATPMARVLPFLAVAAPAPALSVVQKPRQQPPALGSYDNLFALAADAHAYLAVPPMQVDESLKPSRADRRILRQNAKAFTTLPAQRIYQLTISSTGAPSPPSAARDGKAVVWNQSRLQYADGAKTPMLASKPTFAVLASESAASRPGYRLAILTDADHGAAVRLTRIGHRVLPSGQNDIYVGNRFRIEPEDDDNKLGGIDIHLNGTPLATTTSDGRAPGLLTSLKEGVNRLSIQGSRTQANPPGPATTSNFDRLWRQRDFDVLVKDRRILQVDDELVESPGVRLLVDPVWMRLVSGVSTAKPMRGRPVSLVIVHRTENGDARGTLGTWQETQQKRYNTLLAEFRANKGRSPTSQENADLQGRANVAAPYMLARDGTLIKTAPDTNIVNHANGGWGPLTTGTPPNQKRVDTNELSVGIEICKFHDEPHPYTEAQYAHLTWLFGEYCKSTVHPLDIVGHSDVRDKGKDDPGLAFEWSRLEAQGFGLRRPGTQEGQPPALVSPLPQFPDALNFGDPMAQAYRQPWPPWHAAMQKDLAQFPTLFATELALGGRKAADAVDATVGDLLKTIGYHQNLDPQNQGKSDIARALLSFRSHFFSGARRILFALRTSAADERLYEEEAEFAMDKEDDELWRLTAVWVKQVSDLVTAMRTQTSPTLPLSQPLPAAPR